ncbi:MAG: 4'-phosphopantetheinyl transferase superfamily protein [Prevotella sp.]|nr:4'-phosphopantetheinyl transferase superfamily protein [Prevotella sp.]
MVYIDSHPQLLDLTEALAAVSAERRTYALRYRREEDQRLCLSAYLLLQRALREEYGLSEVPPFCIGEHGKPVLEGYPDIHFNLSHCREAVACVVSTHPVGIDIEMVDSFDEALLPTTMNEKEQQIILESPHPESTFIRFWTMKESLLKLTGEGITDNLPSVLSKLEATGESQNISFQTTFHNRYIYTVASKEQDKL